MLSVLVFIAPRPPHFFLPKYVIYTSITLSDSECAILYDFFIDVITCYTKVLNVMLKETLTTVWRHDITMQRIDLLVWGSVASC